MLNLKLVVRIGLLSMAGAIGLGETAARAQAPDAVPPSHTAIESSTALPTSPGFLQSSQVDRGFVLRVSLGGAASATASLLASPSGATLNLGTGLQTGLFAGGKIGRVMAGLNVDYKIAAWNQGSSVSSTISLVMCTPEVIIGLARTADRRVEFIADFGVGIGALIVTVPQTATMGGNSTLLDIGYQLAPGVRFWAHPHFAIEGLAGVNGQFLPDLGNGSIGGQSIHSVFASVGLAGVI